MERFLTFLSGRIISVVLLVIFNVTIVRIMTVTEYSLFALILALASISNTLGSLGAQRFLPKYVSMARAPANSAVVQKILIAFTGLRLAAVLISACLCLGISSLWLDNDIRVEASIFGLFVVSALVSSLYADAEVISQSLNQQRFSRFVAISEPLIRVSLVLVTYLLNVPVTASQLMFLMIGTQGLGLLALTINAYVHLSEGSTKAAQVKGSIRRREVAGIMMSGYVSGLTALGASPPLIRLIAANFLSASEFAALSFVQTMTLSLQRYSPGFLLFPFAEPAIMGWQTGQSSHRSTDAGAALSIISKVDALAITFGILVLAPIGGDVIAFLAGGDVSSRTSILLLAMTAIIMGTIVRCTEVSAAFVGDYRVILWSSALSIFFVSMLVLFGESLGLLGVLTFPIIDSLCRSFLMESAARRGGVRYVIDWAIFGLCLALIAGSVLLSELSFFSTAEFASKLFYVAGMVAIGLAAFFLFRPLRREEGELLNKFLQRSWSLRIVSWMLR